MSKSNRVFISYARSDGHERAKALHRRLADERGFSVWQDITHLRGGQNWWAQIREAIEQVNYLVLLMTPGALNSEFVRMEWRLARQEGVCVIPVMEGDNLDLSISPRWMRRTHIVRLDIREQWDVFIQDLSRPCRLPRVPFMAPDLPANFVDRPREYGKLVESLLDRTRQEPIAITTSLRGSGGFGKTTLAIAVCHDQDVLTAFDDGILWVTLGQTPNIVELLSTLYAALNNDRPQFISEEDAVRALSELLAEKDCLIVLDDAWNISHLRPFLRGGKGCARLITTRDYAVADVGLRIDVDEMALAEAVKMITSRLPCIVAETTPIERLARRLGEWPLMLELAASALRYRLTLGDSLDGALGFLGRALDKRGVTAFDHHSPEERNQAIARSLDVSIDFLDEQYRSKYFQLAVFPEDIDIPMSAVSCLWQLDDVRTELLIQQFSSLSLLSYRIPPRTIRLHDVVRSYIADKLPSHAQFHAILVKAWLDPFNLLDPYAWRWYTYHAFRAGCIDLLRTLLSDFRWLEVKLSNSDINLLIADYNYVSDLESFRLMKRALQLGAHAIQADEGQLRGQVAGRLLLYKSFDDYLSNLFAGVLQPAAIAWLRPLTASLAEPNGPVLQTLVGHREDTTALAIDPECSRIVSASSSIYVWDLKGETAVLTFSGHSDSIIAVAVTPDGRFVVSLSPGDLKIWDIKSGTQVSSFNVDSEWGYPALALHNGREIAVAKRNTITLWNLGKGEKGHIFGGHTEKVSALALTRDGKYCVSGSEDGNIILWQLDNASQVRVFSGHSEKVTSLSVPLHDRFIVSGSADKTIRIWDLKSGDEIRRLEGHGAEISAVAALPDGQTVLSAAHDATMRAWNIVSGKQEFAIRGHALAISNMVVSDDGRIAVSAASAILSRHGDKALKVWDVDRLRAGRRQPGHTDSVTVVIIFQDGKRVASASADGTVRIWDSSNGVEVFVLDGHSGGVNAIAITSNGNQLLSASQDATVKAWDLNTGLEQYALLGHLKGVYSLAITADDHYAISGSLDSTIKIWDLTTGVEIRTLEGHADCVTEIVVDETRQRIISNADDGKLKIWDFESGRELRDMKTPSQQSRYSAIQGALSGTLIVSNTGYRFYPATDKEPYRSDALESGLLVFNTALAVSADGNRAILGGRFGQFKAWDFSRDRELLTCHQSRSPMASMFSTAPQRMLDGTARKGHSDDVNLAAITPCGRFAVTAAEDDNLILWDLDSDELVSRFRAETRMSAVAISSDGKLIAAGEFTGQLHLLLLETPGIGSE